MLLLVCGPAGVDGVLLRLVAVDAAEYDRWGLVTAGLLLDLEEELFETLDLSMHAFSILSLVKVL